MPGTRNRTVAARPRLGPAAVLLERRPGELQVGIGPEAVVLDDAGGRWRSLLSRCSGRATTRQLLGSSDLDPDTVSPVLAELNARELVTLEPPRPVSPRRGRLVGAGELGSAVARLLPAAGLDVVYVVDPSPPDAARYPSSAARSQAEALCGRLDARRFRPVGHWSKPGGVSVALTIVSTPTLETDRVITDDLVRADQPHLVLRPLPDGVVLGPLVVPGRTPCLRCCDLHRRDADPTWPVLLRQLIRMPAELDPLLLGWAAATAAVQVRGFLAGRAVDTLGGSLELRTPDLRQGWRPWTLHPECSCHW